jgi:hypothetical protein
MRRTWGVVTVLVGLVALGTGSLFAFSFRVFRDEPERLTSLQEAAQVTGLSFPPGSSLLDGKVCRCWNAYLYARVQLPPHQVPRFFQQAPFAGKTYTALDLNIPAEVRRQWRLDAVRDFRSAEGGELQRGGVRQALVSLDNPSEPILHLYWFDD